ncbi:bifunctional hydroxymethylpyrimidine kinase/phosphomethylpyrimidine kinase [Aureibacter tunicatorum]|uniref:hydroxymethylpyrimidine kinase n=1 Tax=Aureibacter tunicatorum TaxID=866807 RepID=A0AAE3XKE2_9BACT|nr:bifunctional hydroxymethylpyrimidine kinase/phosphomethylpyrimidine kinase [Aureibacter tunicatorum]MDR6238248.1 hydroxymethylpyrimidine/phosphomethylpyrimidine kinase [Aureibacter tunicatorum]BDD03281.1 hydroxymethylpyrimidine/phosphomethylpyrimidine kinase [Aureibacter tunicatorum]
MKNYKRVLSIAGSDSGGGAGIQADLKTISALGCYGMTAITAITAQNTQGVFAIHPIPAEIVVKQIEVVIDDIGVDAVKIGMLHSAELIEAIADVLERKSVGNIVLDPVMVATSGDRLIQEEAVNILKSRLIPLSTVLTPNMPEAEVLLGRKLENDRKDLLSLSELGAGSVLLKGGHGEGEICADWFMDASGKILSFQNSKIDTKNTHGTGCTLSSAIASYLAKGMTKDDAVGSGIEYIHQAIKQGADYRLGQGHGAVKHFYLYKNWD